MFNCKKTDTISQLSDSSSIVLHEMLLKEGESFTGNSRFQFRFHYKTDSASDTPYYINRVCVRKTN